MHIKFGENRDPFSSFFKEWKADFFYKKHKKLKVDNKWDVAWNWRESKSWNFVESCGRRSPWCIPNLVIMGTHLVYFSKCRRQIFSIKSIKSSKLIINELQHRSGV